jgi:16S rRNA (adenine1518-N6/adenine1519-N6)-dimethyltransferase
LTRGTAPASRRRKALGQHFLSSAPAARRMVEQFAPAPGETILEIGPGQGVLTALLLEAGARVVAVEMDPALAEALRRRFGALPGLKLVEADILRCDIAALLAPGPARLLANLPYAISGEILARLLARSDVLTSMTVMLQREVVNRLAAKPGGRVYGSLSMLAQYFTQPRITMQLAPGSFSPPPKVSSSVVEMPFRAVRELPAGEEAAYPRFIRMLFAHRRRTLLNNLKAGAHQLAGGLADPAGTLRQAGIDPGRRPETLAREEAIRLYQAWRAQSGGPGVL